MTMQKTYWQNNHILDTLQDAFGRMIVRRSDLQEKDVCQEGSAAEALYLLAGAVLVAAADSHSCLDIEQWTTQLKQKHDKQNDLAKRLDEWQKKCQELRTNVLAVLRSETESFDTTHPLVLLQFDGQPTCAYLNRYLQYEQNIGKRVKAFCGLPIRPLSPERLSQVRQTNFQQKHEAQTSAIENALQHDLAIITGGPGCGKTTVLTELLAFHMKEFQEKTGTPMNIAICAPTGKAAARMKESIIKAIDNIVPDGKMRFGEILDSLEKLRPYTIHKLLGIFLDSDYPCRNATRPLDYDLVAVDECSMMSLKIFNDLLAALKPGAKVILLGDPNQLQSVEEGNVLAELCRNLPENVNKLTKNFRSADNELLSQYATAIINGNADINILYGEMDRSQNAGLFIGYELPSEKSLEKKIREFLSETKILQDDASNWISPTSPEEALQRLNQFKILTAVREGAYGVDGLNKLMRNILNVPHPYANGVPMLVTRNDDVTELRNGDIGVCFNGNVYFPMPNAQYRSFAPAQLPPHEPAFAMTIHKSQGSDYDNVLMVLPDKDMPLLTRELVYTGMTRTKKNFVLLAKKDILSKAQQRKTVRWSGLDKWL